MEHLKQCPAEFLKESVYTNPKNGLDTNALVLDLYRKFSRAFDSVSEIMNSDHENGYTSEHLIAIHLAVCRITSYNVCYTKLLRRTFLNVFTN